MRDSTTPSRFTQRLKRVLAGAMSSMLVAGGLVAVSVAAPLVQAPAASAAANFICGPGSSSPLYATGNSTANTANPRDLFRIDPATGATSVAYSPGITSTVTLNQLAISRDGAQIFWTDGTTATSNIYEYTPATDAAPQTTPRGTATGGTAAPNNAWNTMGGFDLATNRYIYGGAVYTPPTQTTASSASLTVHSYNPTNNAIQPSAATISLPGATGANGDLAFSPAGTMYVVTGGNSTQTQPGGGGDNAQLYRVTGGIPTTGTASYSGVPLGGRIDNVRGLNSIAFGADGFLYLFGQTPTSSTAGTPQLIKVNPSNGDIVSRTTLAGPAAGGLTDLASCASPSTVRGEVVLDEPRQDPSDQFQVVIGGGGLSPADASTTGTTTGTGSTVANNPVTGPVIVLPGDTVTVDQRPAAGSATPGPDYAREWVCRDTAYGNAVVSSGFGPQASFTMPTNPAIGSNIVCSFTTEEAVSSATIDKTFTGGPITAIGQRIDYSITVTNTGNVPLQNVVVTDPAPGLTVTCPAGSSTVNPVGAFNTVNTVTCTASRLATAQDFQGTGTVDNTATVSYTTQQPTPGNAPRTASDTASFTPDRTPPAATADAQGGGTIGQPVTVNVVGNDGTVDPASVTIVGAPGDGKRLEVEDVGVWTVSLQGTITFTPASGYTGNPAPITYSVAGPNGVRAEATVTVTYGAQAQPQRSDDNPIGSTVTVDPLTGLVGTVQPGTVAIVTGPNPGDVAPSLTVPEGEWTVVDDEIVFTPNPGVTTDPAPIEFQVISTDGTPTRNTVTVTYQPVANPDTTPQTTPGSPASVAPLANDQGTIDPATFAFLDEDGDPIIDPITAAPATSVTIPNQGTWSQATVDGQLVVTFTPAPGFTGTPTPIGYQVAGPGPDRVPVQSTISAPYLPLAVGDSALLQPLTDPATPVVVADILGNDAGDLDPATVQLLDPATDTYVDGPVEIPGVGTWEVVQDDDGTVDVVFTAAPGFFGDPAPIRYQVEDANGDATTALITVTFQPVANPDVAGGFATGTTASITPLANDLGDLVPASFTFLDAAGNPVGQSYAVAGQGTWTAAVVGGVLTVTFEPELGYEGDPSLVRYQVSDTKGATARSSITFDYDAAGADDVSLSNPVGNPVTLLDVLADDDGEFDPATFTFNPIPGSTRNDDGSLTVAGQGTWTFVVTPTGAVDVTFTPLPTFQSDPSVITYTVQAVGTGSSTAQLIVGYVQVADPDQVLLAPLTEPATPVVVADILGNDEGDFDGADVQLYDPAANGGAGAWLPAGDDLVVPGEGTWAIVVNDDGTVDVTFTAEDGFQGNPTPIRYQVPDAAGDVVESTITVTFQPVANDDADAGFAIGEVASLTPLANDLGAFDTATFTFLNPDGSSVGALADYSNGEGTWSVAIDPETGVLTVSFDPNDGFVGDPTPVGYAIAGNGGVVVDATITFDYVPEAQPDSLTGVAPGTVATVPNVLGNDLGVLNPATFAFVPGAEGGELVDGTLVVPGQGTWSTVVTPGQGGAPATVDVVFTPEEGFLSDPDPVAYVVDDLSGTETGSTITVDYLQVANPDQVLLAPLTEPGTPVRVADILGNDVGDLDPASVQLFDPAANGGAGAWLPVGAELVVPGEGTWQPRVNDDGTADVVFVAEDGFQGDPTPIRYQAADAAGDLVDSTITVTFQPVANDDAESGFAIGANAQVSPLANDLGELDVTTFTFVPPTGLTLQEDGSLIVPGEGTWSFTVDVATGVLTVVFDPIDGFEGDPTPVDYAITSTSGVTVDATITVDYQPLAVDDSVTGLEPGTEATLADVLGNDAGDLDPATFAFVPGDEGGRLVDGDLVVDGEGTWSFAIDEETGVVTVTFTPEEGFLSDPTPVSYTVEDRSGSETGALLTVDYLQAAADDANLDQPITEPVTVADILGNDAGDFLPESVQLFDPATESWLEPGAELAVPGEGVWTIVVDDDGTVDVVFTPEEGYLGDPTPVRYQVADAGGDLAQATITVSYLPVANDDEDLANAFGEPVVVDVLANDVGDFDPSTVSLYDPAADGGVGAWLEPGVSLVVAGQGTWSIDPQTGAVTFTPEAGYGGDPDVVSYRVTDSTGDTVQATITITYGPTAVDDASLRNAQGTTVTVDVLANDLGQFDPASARIVSGDQLVTELVVPGQGTWTVDPATGAIAFTPASGFTGNPTPITYAVTDVSGDVTEATVTITYLPKAIDDRSEGNAPGTAVTVDPLANDAGDLDPTTVEIRDPQTGDWGKTVVVPGEGTWTVDPVTGAITFTPERGFTGDPTPIAYRVTDVNGEVTQATVTIDYRQVAGIPGIDLPRTGAEITVWSLIAGLGLLLAGAAVWLIRRRRTDVTDA